MISFVHKVNKDWYLEAEAKDAHAYGKGLSDVARFLVYKVDIKTKKRENVAVFSFCPMPGCCGIVVSTATTVFPDFRGTEISNPFRELKTALAKHLNYSCMIATSIKTDKHANGNMHKSGYAIAATFKNANSGNTIDIGIKKL